MGVCSCGITVIIPAFQAGDPGSTPGMSSYVKNDCHNITIMTIFEWFKTKKYSALDTENFNESFTDSAPIPICKLIGCVEERVVNGSLVYPYCKKHDTMFKQGVLFINICQHPGCVREIINKPDKLYCFQHLI